MKQTDYPPEILEKLQFGRARRSGQQIPEDNRTVPLDLLNICKTQCEDCGVQTSRKRVVHSKRLSKPYTHWSHLCLECGKYKCPETGEFNLSNQELRLHHMQAAGLQLPKKRTKKLQNDK